MKVVRALNYFFIAFSPVLAYTQYLMGFQREGTNAGLHFEPIIIYLIFFIFIISAFLNKKKIKINWLFGQFAFFSLLSSLMSKHGMLSVNNYFQMILPAFLFIVINENITNTKQDAKRLIYSICLLSMFIVMFSFLKIARYPHVLSSFQTLASLDGRAIIGGIAHTNITTRPFLLTFPFFVFLCNRRPDKRIILGLFICLNFIFIFLSFSRSAWIIIAVECLLLQMYFFKKEKIKTKIIIIFIIIIVFSLLCHLQTRHQTFERFASKEGISSTKARYIVWDDSLNYIKRHLLLFTGIGIDTFRVSTIDVYYNSKKAFMHAHNYFLNLVVELGIIPCIFYIVFILSCLYKAIASKQKEKIFVLIALIGFLVALNWDYVFMINKRYYVEFTFFSVLILARNIKLLEK